MTQSDPNRLSPREQLELAHREIEALQTQIQVANGLAVAILTAFGIGAGFVATRGLPRLSHWEMYLFIGLIGSSSLLLLSVFFPRPAVGTNRRATVALALWRRAPRTKSIQRQVRTPIDQQIGALSVRGEVLRRIRWSKYRRIAWAILAFGGAVVLWFVTLIK